jgi:hypothetical protein
MKRHNKNNISLLVAAVFFVLSSVGFGHGSTEHPHPTPEQLSQVQPAIPGAFDFAQELSDAGRYLLTEKDRELLDHVQANYAQMNLLKSHDNDELTPEADFYRWQAEIHLVELVQSMSEAIPILIGQDTTAGKTAEVIEMPGQSGALLLKVITGDALRNFSVQELNIRREGPPNKTPVTITAPGISYVLLKLDEIPSNESSLQVAFKAEDALTPSYWHLFNFKGLPLGQYRFSLTDETGNSTPALVRITAHSNGKLWEPPNAIDLGPIMHSITSPGMQPIVVGQCYGPGRGYRLYIPGPFRGRYWVVPEAFEMALPAGKYDIHIHHGPEYVPIKETFSVTADKWTRKEYSIKRFENMNDRGWYSGDDHVHSRLMSSEDAYKLMTSAKAMNTNLINILEMGDAWRTWFSQRGFGKEYQVRDGNYILVPGQEDPRSQLGHAIGLNLKSMVRDLDRYFQTDWIADNIHAQGGLYGITHVGEKACLSHRDMSLSIPQDKVDFNSILQIRLGTDWYYDFLNLGYRMVASAGSDTPYGGSVGSVRVYAYLGKDKPFTADTWFAAFEAGKTYVSNGPMLEFTVDGKLPGEEIQIDGKQRLKVHAKAWGLAGITAPTSLKVVVNGETVKEMTAQNEDQETFEVDIDVDCEYGAWIAAHAVGPDGLGAHSTPVYVQRDGFRHWNVEKAQAVIDRQLGILDEIEEMIAETEKMKGTLSPLDNWNGRLIEQADVVRQRVKTVRHIYEDLEKTLEKEKTIRKS